MNVTQLTQLRGQIESHQEQLESEASQAISVEDAKTSINAQIDNVEARLKVRERKKGTLLTMGGGGLKWAQALADFQNLIPRKAWVDELTLYRESIEPSTVVGGSYQNQQVSEFIDNLNGSKFFSNASFRRTEAAELNEQSIIYFELAFDMVSSSF